MYRSMLRSTLRSRPVGPITCALALGAVATTGCGGSQKGPQNGSREGVTAAEGVVATSPPRDDHGVHGGTGPGTGGGTPSSSEIVVPANVSYATAESAYRVRQYPTAAAMFEAYASRRPENPWGHYMLGLAAWKSGQLDRAQHAFEDALARDPKHVKSLINLSRVLLEEGQASDALARAQEAVAVDSGLSDAWRTLGRVQAHLGDTDAALDAYRRAITITPTDAWAMNNMGLLLIEVGRYDDALGPLARAVQLDSTTPVFANNLGIALERSGHLTAAATEYQRALTDDSTYAKARISLARVDGHPDAVGVAPIDLSTVAAGFVQEIAGKTVISSGGSQQ